MQKDITRLRKKVSYENKEVDNFLLRMNEKEKSEVAPIFNFSVHIGSRFPVSKNVLTCTWLVLK